MFSLSVPWWEIVLRAALIYVVLFALIRIAGKREVGELSPFDLVFLLVIAEQASQALSGGDKSILGAGIGLVTMFTLNLAVTYLTARIPRAERVLEGKPRFLVAGGKVDYETMRREAVSKNELLAALRDKGCLRPSQADWAVLETDGTISVRPRAT
jgi:uncharacterized membrane protein YcaP (DUF421 family)